MLLIALIFVYDFLVFRNNLMTRLLFDFYQRPVKRHLLASRRSSSHTKPKSEPKVLQGDLHGRLFGACQQNMRRALDTRGALVF
ncbi:hypothetical protein TNCV_3175031 [Trichonephila clavipes]|nr:hypothetical protein TNCV_3175031 [Trichonephila clavipes]